MRFRSDIRCFSEDQSHAAAHQSCGRLSRPGSPSTQPLAGTGDSTQVTGILDVTHVFIDLSSPSHTSKMIQLKLHVDADVTTGRGPSSAAELLLCSQRGCHQRPIRSKVTLPAAHLNVEVFSPAVTRGAPQALSGGKRAIFLGQTVVFHQV